MLIVVIVQQSLVYLRIASSRTVEYESLQVKSGSSKRVERNPLEWDNDHDNDDKWGRKTNTIIIIIIIFITTWEDREYNCVTYQFNFFPIKHSFRLMLICDTKNNVLIEKEFSAWHKKEEEVFPLSIYLEKSRCRAITTKARLIDGLNWYKLKQPKQRREGYKISFLCAPLAWKKRNSSFCKSERKNNKIQKSNFPV